MSVINPLRCDSCVGNTYICELCTIAPHWHAMGCLNSPLWKTTSTKLAKSAGHQQGALFITWWCNYGEHHQPWYWSIFSWKDLSIAPIKVKKLTAVWTICLVPNDWNDVDTRLYITKCIWKNPADFDIRIPDSKVHGATWGPFGADRTQVGPMFAPWILLSGNHFIYPGTCTLWSLRSNYNSIADKVSFMLGTNRGHQRLKFDILNLTGQKSSFKMVEKMLCDIPSLRNEDILSGASLLTWMRPQHQLIWPSIADLMISLYTSVP